jgi:hypothetical protein
MQKKLESGDAMPCQQHRAIRERAYTRWEQEGFPNGKDLEHWLLAETETESMYGKIVPIEHTNSAPIIPYPSQLPPVTGASDKDKFDILHKSLMQYYVGIIDFEFKHATFLVLGLGWLITSESAREFIKGHFLVRTFSLLTILTLTVLHGLWISKYYGKSRNTFRLMTELSFVPKSYYDGIRIPQYMKLSFIAIHLIVSLMICIIILQDHFPANLRSLFR